MAERRMFAKTIIDSDVFLDMPLSTQALYFHLSMRADDEGFINNPKKIMRMIGASQNELEILIAKRYLLGFDSGVIIIKHWRIHNYIQKDRFKETLYKEERAQITVKENKSYTEGENSVLSHENTSNSNDIQYGYNMDTNGLQDGDTGKVSLGEFREGKFREDYKEKNNKKEISLSSSFSSFNPGNKFTPPTDGQKTLSKMIESTRKFWNSKDNLPDCDYEIMQLNNIQEMTVKFAALGEDKILAAIKNLSDLIDHVPYKFRPRTFNGFIEKSVDNWLDSVEPWKQFEDDKTEPTYKTEQERYYHKGLELKKQQGDKWTVKDEEWLEVRKQEMEDSLNV